MTNRASTWPVWPPLVTVIASSPFVAATSATIVIDSEPTVLVAVKWTARWLLAAASDAASSALAPAAVVVVVVVPGELVVVVVVAAPAAAAPKPKSAVVEAAIAAVAAVSRRWSTGRP